MATFGRSKVKLWESSLEKLARIFSDKYRIKVVFKHDLCMTTGKTIYLPVIPEGASDEFLDAIHGYLDHEVAHNQFTEMDMMKAAHKIGKKTGIMLNALEDPRVEREMIKKWRGSKINLNNCREWSLKQLQERWDELSDFGKIVQSIVVRASVDENHWFVQTKIAPDQALMERLSTIKEYTDQIGTMASTKEAFEAAKKIIEKLQEVEEPSEEGEGEGEGEEGQGQQNCPEPGEEELAHDEEVLSTANQIQQEAKNLKQKHRQQNNTGEDRYLIYSTENDVIEYITDGSKVETAQFLRDSRQMVNAIRQKFRLNLLSHTQNRWECGKRRGKIDNQSVHRVILGTGKDVFKRQVEAPGFDTVASLFIDHSNSMYPDSIDLAAMSALVFGEALNDINVPFEICGYSTGYYNEGVEIYQRATPEERQMYTRWGKLWIGVYKKFDEMWPTTRHRCLQMSRNGKYNTYDGEAVRIAAQRILLRPEKRKILFVFSDGYPCPNVRQFSDVHIAYLKTVAKEIEKVVEVFAVGVNSDAVKEFYSNYVVIHDIRDLPTVMLTEMDRLIRKGQNAYSRASK